MPHGAVKEVEGLGIDGTPCPILRGRAVVHAARTTHGLEARGQREQSIRYGDVGREVADLVLVRLVDPAIVHAIHFAASNPDWRQDEHENTMSTGMRNRFMGSLYRRCST